MTSVDIGNLQPLFQSVAESISPDSAAVDCPVATAMYWAVRIHGEIGNGGVAQLIWNLHDLYDTEVLCEALATIGAHDAVDVVRRAFDYVAETPTRKDRFFAKGPFAPPKPLVKLTDRYADLVPSVATLVGRYVAAHWETPSFQAVVKASGVGDLRRQAAATPESIWSAVDEADGDTLLAFVAAGLDPDTRDDNGRTLVEQMLGRNDKVAARVDIIERLVAAGADLEARNAHGQTPLSRSTFYGGTPAYLRCLLELGADIDHMGDNGRTAIFGATKKIESLRLLLDAGANPDHVAADGASPLGFALEEYSGWLANVDNRFRVEKMSELRTSIDLLLSRGAQFSDQAVTTGSLPGGHTELSAVAGDAELLAALAGAPNFQATPDVHGRSGAWTALHAAGRAGVVESVTVLLDAGVAANAALAASDLGRRVWAGATPLDVAADQATIDLLIDRGAQAGERTSHDVYVTSRGNHNEELAKLFVGHLDASQVAADEIVNRLPMVEGATLDEVDGEYRIFSAALLDRCKTATEASQLEARVGELGGTTEVV